MKENISETIKEASKAWLDAAKILDIRVTAPFSVSIGKENLQCIAHVHDFGSPKGTIVGVLHPQTFNTDDRIKDYAEQHGLFYSFVNPQGWIKYNETIFKDALEDWGYFGSAGKCPAWFKGIKYGKGTGNVT